MQTSQLTLDKSGGLGPFSLTANAVPPAPPKGEAIARRDTRAAQAPAAAPSHRRGLFERLDHWLWTLQQRNVEAYLAKATDVYDLEARIRALERGVPMLRF